MTKINQYNKVLLKDGRTASIVEIFGEHEAYEADIDLDGDWETDTIYPEDIQEIIQS